MSKLRSIKQLSLSVFVVSSFFTYALQPRAIVPQSPKLPPQKVVNSNALQMISRTAGRLYRDGTYLGSVVKAGYGRVQVQAVIQNGKIFSIKFLEYPQQLQTSQKINTRAIPWLQQEAIQAQTALVDAVSGATITSQAFTASLQVALDAAQN